MVEQMVDALSEDQKKDAEQKLQTIKKRAGYCGLCTGVMRDLRGHCSRRPNCKAHLDTRALTAEELQQLEKEFWDEQTNPEGAKERRIKAAKECHQRKWTPPEGEATEREQVYRMNFGRYAPKKMTVEEVLAENPGYFK